MSKIFIYILTYGTYGKGLVIEKYSMLSDIWYQPFDLYLKNYTYLSFDYVL